MAYEVKFLNHGGFAFSSITISADSDRQAIESARERLRGGPGHAYEIWNGTRLVHTERLRGWEQVGLAAPSDYRDRVRVCIAQALAEKDIQQRRALMFLAEFVLGISAPTAAPRYKVVLIAKTNKVIAELDYQAESAREAFAMATVLADTACDGCAQLELWHAQKLVGSATLPARLPVAGELGERAQRRIVERLLILHESCETIAASDAFLHKFDRWLRIGTVVSA